MIITREKIRSKNYIQKKREKMRHTVQEKNKEQRLQT